MNRALRVVLLSSAISAAVVAGPVAPASSDTPRCASYKEFRQNDMGMKRARVHRIFDTPGQFAGGFAGGYSRYYGSCQAVRIGGGDGGATISYDGRTNRVVEKRWIGYE